MIIVPITATEVNAALDLVELANKHADAIELRLDYFSSLSEHDLHRLIKDCKKPCICTCRGHKEGGKFRGNERIRAQALKAAIRNGCHYVDIEYEMKSALRKELYGYAHRHGAKVILSKHVPTHTPALRELSQLLEKMRKEKTHVVKIVTHAKKHSDNKVILALFRDANKKRVRLIAFCMGSLGIDSRILSRFLGAFATFASLGKGTESASGQIHVHEMRRAHSDLRSVL